MKSNVLKIGLPLAVVAFGLASAASTSSMSRSSKPVAQIGYYHISHNPSCQAVQNCDENGTWNCLAPDKATQLYSVSSNCNTPLKRSTQF
jgi:predicted transglutaminase-like cysteine proteinase